MLKEFLKLLNQSKGAVAPIPRTFLGGRLRPGPNSPPVPFDNPLRLLQGKAQYLTRQAENIPGAILDTSRGVLRNLSGIPAAAAPLFKPSSVFSSVPGLRNPVVSNVAGLAGVPTGLAGSMFLVGQIEGDTPQRASTGRAQKVAEAAGRSGEWGRYAPAQYRYPYNLEGAAPPGSASPASDLNSSLFSGPQAGQQTPPPPSLIGTGVMSNGAGVPAQRENVLNRTLSQEVLNAAQQYSAPTNVPLSSFYEGQQQLGRSMMQKGNLVSELQALGAGTGMAPENFQQWVKANPGLAYREMLRLKQM